MTNIYTIAAQTIKDTVSAVDVGKAIGLNVDSHGRCSCPFHNGKDKNMKLFDGNRGYTCFVCHNSGDVISFVRNLYSNMSYKQCLQWFSDTFHLGLDLDGTITPEQKRQAENALKMRRNAVAFQQWKERMQFDLVLTAEDIVKKLEQIRDEKRPRTYGEWDPDFCRAVELLPEARRFAEDCIMYSTKKPEDS